MPPRPIRTIGSFRHRLTVKTSTSATDAIGGLTPTWKDNGVVWASIEMLGGQERGIADNVQATQTYRVAIRYRRDVTARDRFEWDDRRNTTRTFEVLSAYDEDGRGRVLICDCAEVTT